MTLSAPKPAYHIQEPEPSEAEPFAPVSCPDLANDPHASPDQLHELPCHVETAPDDEPEQQPIEDLHASFHEQLAVLVRALESDDGHRLDAGEDAEPEPVDEHDEDIDAPGNADVEPLSAGSGLASLASLRSALNGRARGFVIGLGASIVAGGAVLTLASGDEPSAIASNVVQSDPQAASAPATNESSDLQLRASLLDEIPAGLQTDVGSLNRAGAGETGAGQYESGVEFAAAVPGMVIAPADEPLPVDQHVGAVQHAYDLADAIADATEPERVDDLRDESPAEVATSFETIVETASDNQAASDETESPVQLLASARGTGPTAQVVKHVNMRAGPDNSAAVLAIIPEGEPVEVVQCDQWCEVIAEGQRGWIYKDLLSGAIGG